MQFLESSGLYTIPVAGEIGAAKTRPINIQSRTKIIIHQEQDVFHHQKGIIK